MDHLFPNLVSDGYVATSPVSAAYNCVAWAAGAVDSWWWPDAALIYYWPEGVARKETVEVFVEAFVALGYRREEQGDINQPADRVAIYARDGRPTHAARQLPSGFWTSKLGSEIDITHTLAGLEGELYGQVVAILRRESS